MTRRTRTPVERSAHFVASCLRVRIWSPISQFVALRHICRRRSRSRYQLWCRWVPATRTPGRVKAAKNATKIRISWRSWRLGAVENCCHTKNSGYGGEPQMCPRLPAGTGLRTGRVAVPGASAALHPIFASFFAPSRLRGRLGSGLASGVLTHRLANDRAAEPPGAVPFTAAPRSRTGTASATVAVAPPALPSGSARGPSRSRPAPSRTRRPR